MNNQTHRLICGMEIHAELKTASKMFCGCKNDPFHAEKPNIYTCPVCLGMPGALPVANKSAIEWTVKLGLALNCQINLFSKFDRKHYFYPDLPKGYQISQYDIPFCHDGYIETSFGKVGIHRIHLEEDTGKLQHKTIEGEKVTLVDFNRSGVPLVEIVTEPNIYSPEQAKEYAKQIRDILRALDVADCDMEQGGMRLEANISLQEADQTTLPNYKVEVKNINSFRFLEQAISFEVQRQTLELMDGKTPRQETRGWDSVNNVTFPQRSKEDAEDYRYFPDPDIPPIRLQESLLQQLQAGLSELPMARVSRWQQVFNIEERYSSQLMKQPEMVTKYEQLFQAASTKKLDVNKVANLLVNKKLAFDASAELDTVLATFSDLIKVDQVDDTEVVTAIQLVLSENPNEVSSYKAGKEQVIHFLLGQVMRKLGKKVDAQLIRTGLQKQLQA